MLKRVRLLLILAAVLSLALVTTTQAQGTLTAGTPVEGTYAGEDQVYTFNATRGQLLLISMNSEVMDSTVAIGQGGNEIADDDDSGGDDNALLAFVVQADGDYDIIAGAWFWNEGDEGAYTLQVDVVEPTMASYGTAVTLTPADAETRFVYTVFEAAADDVVNVWVDTADGNDDADLSVALMGVDGQEIESDDDDWYGRNALIRRVVLPDAGLYLVRVSEAFRDEPLLGPVNVNVEQTERLFLTPEPQELVMGDAEGQKGTEVYFIDAEVGKTYRIIVTIQPFPDEDAGIEMELFDTAFFFDPYIETRHGVGLTWDYTAQSTGQVRLDVHPNFFGRDISAINYTIAMEVME
jgi:hypothetical protein